MSPHNSRSQRLQDENMFLRMKLMLERDADFQTFNNDVPPEIENIFLHSVIEFERQYEQAGRVTVFEKIGRPIHYPPADAIPAHEMERAWQSLLDHMRRYGISIETMGLDVPAAELYRFATEEFFFQVVDNINMPGMINCFVYGKGGLEDI